jgi:hypothetical protein
MPVTSLARLFVASVNIGEYTDSGFAVNPSLISYPVQEFVNPVSIAVVGSYLFVLDQHNGTIGKYTTSGETVNASLVTGLSNPNNPQAMAVSGTTIFVLDDGGYKIGEYTTSGTTVNASLVYLPNGSTGIAVSGTDLFIVSPGTWSINTGLYNPGSSSISEYTTSGALVSASLVTPVCSSAQIGGLSIAASGTNLFVAMSGTFGADGFDPASGAVSEYTTSGATVNASLVTGLKETSNITVSGTNLYVANLGDGTIGEYTTSGATVNASLISGLSYPQAIAVTVSPSTNLVAAKGDVLGANSVLSVAGPPTIDAAGNIAIHATMTGANKSGILLYSATNFTVVAAAGTADPVTGAILTKVSDPVLSGNGTLAFIGTLKPGTGGTTTTNATGVYVSQSGTLSLVARQGDVAPGSAGKFTVFNQVVAMNAGYVVFLASLTGVPASQNQGIWAAMPDGSLTPVVEKGNLLDFHGTNKTVKSIGIFQQASNFLGQSRSFDTDAGILVYEATFTDQTWGIYQVLLP